MSKCKCDYCILSTKIQFLLKNLKKSRIKHQVKNIIDELWSRMENAEMELDILSLKK